MISSYFRIRRYNNKYNKILAYKIKYYKKTGEMLKNTPSQYKKEFEWLKEVDSLALINNITNGNKYNFKVLDMSTYELVADFDNK